MGVREILRGDSVSGCTINPSALIIVAGYGLLQGYDYFDGQGFKDLGLDYFHLFGRIVFLGVGLARNVGREQGLSLGVPLLF